MSKTSQRRVSYYQLGYNDAKQYRRGRMIRRAAYEAYVEGYKARLHEMKMKKRGIIQQLRKLFGM